MSLLNLAKTGVVITVDTESTGNTFKQLDPDSDRMVEIGMVKLVNGVEVDKYHAYIDPQRSIPRFATEIHGIDQDFLDNLALKNKSPVPTFEQQADEMLRFMQGADLLCAHNASFEINIINHELSLCEKAYQPIDQTHDWMDSYAAFEVCEPDMRHNLDALVSWCDLTDVERDVHGALLDADLLARCLPMLINRLQEIAGGSVPNDLSDEIVQQGQTIALAKAVERKAAKLAVEIADELQSRLVDFGITNLPEGIDRIWHGAVEVSRSRAASRLNREGLVKHLRERFGARRTDLYTESESIKVTCQDGRQVFLYRNVRQMSASAERDIKALEKDTAACSAYRADLLGDLESERIEAGAKEDASLVARETSATINKKHSRVLKISSSDEALNTLNQLLIKAKTIQSTLNAVIKQAESSVLKMATPCLESDWMEVSGVEVFRKTTTKVDSKKLKAYCEEKNVDMEAWKSVSDRSNLTVTLSRSKENPFSGAVKQVKDEMAPLCHEFITDKLDVNNSESSPEP